MKIAVYGAGGYTGRLAAAEVLRTGAELVLAGRGGERLQTTADGIGLTAPDIRTAGIDDPAGLEKAFSGCDGVVNCAGPFTLYGEPVVRAAIAAGCHYVDTTAEQLYIHKIFTTCDVEAKKAGVTVIPSMSYDLAPADLISHLAGERVEPLELLTLSYDIADFGMTRGSMLSVLQMYAGEDLTYRDGNWVPAGKKAKRPAVTFPGHTKPTLTMKYAGGAVVTLPRHLDVRNVEVVMKGDALVPKAIAPAAVAMMPATAALMGSPFRHLVTKLVNRLPEGPKPAKRARAKFSFVADAVGIDGRRARGIVTGTDVYNSSAKIAVEGLRRLISDNSPAGVLAPSQAFSPAEVLDALAPAGITWRVEETPAG